MGVKTLWRSFHSCCYKVPLARLRGVRVGLDVSHLLHCAFRERLSAERLESTLFGNDPAPAEISQYVVAFVRKLCSAGVSVVVVFDGYFSCKGNVPGAKAGEIEARQQGRATALAAARADWEAGTGGRDAAWRKRLLGLLERTPEIQDAVAGALEQALGSQVVIRQAAAEADHQLAHYYYSQRIDLVAAADGDYLIHGCNMLRLTVRAVE